MSESPGRPVTHLHLESLFVSAGRPPGPGEAVNPAITPTSIYHEGGSYTYGRDGNPTWAALEAALGETERAQAVTFSSGIAAINAVLALIPRGGVVVAPTHAYSGTSTRLNELEAAGELQVRRVPMSDARKIVEQLPGADLVWLESPTNPLLEICDIRTVCAAANAAGISVAVDNTFATCIGQQPLDLGATFSVQSATKYIGGHSDLLLGVVAVRDSNLLTHLRQRRSLLGAVPGVFEAWLALRGLRTMALRVQRSTASALELAQRLSSHSAVTSVTYPGLESHPQHALAHSQMNNFGSIVSFRVAAGAAAADAVCRGTQLIHHVTSLGGVETTMERRARHALEHADVPTDLIRLSVGIEHVDDLWVDLDRALSSFGV